MNNAALFRKISIFSYVLIFLKGSMILVPFGLMLFSGLFSGAPQMKMMIVFADLTLIALFITSFSDRTRWQTVFEVFAFFILLLPFIHLVLSFPFHWFDHFFFLFPLSLFIILFPLSVYLGHKKYLKDMNENRN